VVTLRTEEENIDECQTTLRFAQRAKAVKTRVKDNTVTVLDSAKLLKEVEALRALSLSLSLSLSLTLTLTLSLTLTLTRSRRCVPSSTRAT
jgi:hypothetical protein